MPFSRRTFLQALGLALYLPNMKGWAAPNQDFRLGNLPAPAAIQRIVSAGAPADMLLLAVAPEKLLGFSSFDFSRFPQSPLPPEIARLRKLGRLAGRASTLSLEALVALAPDLIVDCGNADETWISQARRIGARSGIPWVIISGTLATSAQQLLTLGEIVGQEARTQRQATLAQRFINEALAFSHSSRAATRFYAARGAKGLETGLAGSLHTEAAELLGLVNVARAAGRTGLSQVSLENLLQWQPDIILTQEAATWRHITQDPIWRGIDAVAKGNVLLLDGLPFGWLDAPPGVNRLAGLRRLHAWLDPKIQATLQTDLTRYSELFWHAALSPQRYTELMNPR
ncbi:ABC transporter substrate-binding protein [Klebsiella indica]|uniref:Iron ABC transporter substrate-binding protein n=1 Tax=Klebsiella indica TaxID=2582917 RepID=A0A5R9LGZ9_9ENTR|nr:ABC transporter substrate-binding protein [Klebsiella indica]TLV16146.1 iron ABC transporter substrate-binding protein [Klebsiella indica]